MEVLRNQREPSTTNPITTPAASRTFRSRGPVGLPLATARGAGLLVAEVAGCGRPVRMGGCGAGTDPDEVAVVQFAASRRSVPGFCSLTWHEQGPVRKRQASSTLAGYDQGSEINRSARAAMTALSRAASAVESLARALEHRPNSIILGR